ncbi:MAG: monovalent cation/H+ antiporter subunit D family protein [Hyphomicrobiales bacterium]
MSNETLVTLALLIPALGAILIPLARNAPNLRETVTLVTAVALFLAVLLLFGRVMAGERPEASLITIMPGVDMAFSIEPLGMLFALVASSLWIVNSIYSIGYMRGNNEMRQTKFYVCFAVAIASTMGIAFAKNLFTLFIFYEALTLSTYPLVTHKGTDEAKRGGRIYLVLLLATSMLLLLPAIMVTWFLTGTMDFTVGGILGGKADGLVTGVLLAFYAFGIGKAALMPFHFWLPNAMVAPTPVSALLHAVAVVKAGVFSVLKIVVYIFGIDYLAETGLNNWILLVAGTTVVLASLIAMTKDNLKARLAYSTVSQLAYIVLGAELATDLGILGGSMHIAMHAVGKITLFMCAGAIYVAAHKTEISDMSGLGRVMPFTFGAFFIGALCIIGLPPTGGLWSKWYLALGALDAGRVSVLGVLMLSSVLNIIYLMPIPIKGFFGKPTSEEAKAEGVHEAPTACLIAIGITSALCVLLFFFPGTIYELASMIKLR